MKGVKIVNKPYKIVKFNDKDMTLEVKIDSSDDTVWLTIEEMAR